MIPHVYSSSLEGSCNAGSIPLKIWHDVWPHIVGLPHRLALCNFPRLASMVVESQEQEGL